MMPVGVGFAPAILAGITNAAFSSGGENHGVNVLFQQV